MVSLLPKIVKLKKLLKLQMLLNLLNHNRYYKALMIAMKPYSSFLIDIKTRLNNKLEKKNLYQKEILLIN
jgi:hypothetical protein